MTDSAFSADIEAVHAIGAVPVILSVVKHLTGMRFAAVARVTEKNWVACAVDDSIDFGLKPGGELVRESTICHEIRQHRTPVIFGHASAHPIFATHHTTLYRCRAKMIERDDGLSVGGSLLAMRPAQPCHLPKVSAAPQMSPVSDVKDVSVSTPRRGR